MEHQVLVIGGDDLKGKETPRLLSVVQKVVVIGYDRGNTSLYLLKDRLSALQSKRGQAPHEDLGWLVVKVLDVDLLLNRHETEDLAPHYVLYNLRILLTLDLGCIFALSDPDLHALVVR